MKKLVSRRKVELDDRRCCVKGVENTVELLKEG